MVDELAPTLEGAQRLAAVQQRAVLPDILEAGSQQKAPSRRERQIGNSRWHQVCDVLNVDRLEEMVIVGPIAGPDVPAIAVALGRMPKAVQWCPSSQCALRNPDLCPPSGRVGGQSESSAHGPVIHGTHGSQAIRSSVAVAPPLRPLHRYTHLPPDAPRHLSREACQPHGADRDRDRLRGGGARPRWRRPAAT